MCRADESFEDLRQEVLIALIRALPGYRGQAAFLTWAYTIVRTCRGRQLRKLRPTESQAELHLHRSAPPEHPEGPASLHLVEEVDNALSGLSPLDRKVLIMRDIGGYSAREVALATNLTVPAVKTRLHRARAGVRSQLGSQP